VQITIAIGPEFIDNNFLKLVLVVISNTHWSNYINLNSFLQLSMVDFISMEFKAATDIDRMD
jgi:hypothetical protein